MDHVARVVRGAMRARLTLVVLVVTTATAVAQTDTATQQPPPSVPGTRGTSAAFISAFARALSPIRSITSAPGPTKTNSEFSHAVTNAGFSERKP